MSFCSDGDALWAPPDSIGALPGYWLKNRWNLAEERGYPRNLLDDRELVLRCLYTCGDDKPLPWAEAQLQGLRRPVALVFQPGRGKRLQALLEHGGRAELVYRHHNGMVVWRCRSSQTGSDGGET